MSNNLKKELAQLIHYHYGLGPIEDWKFRANNGKTDDVEKLSEKIVNF